MTKSSKIRIALTVLALAAFTAIFFSIPALRIKRFWFAYGCGVFAILWQIYAIAVTDGKKDTADHYYGYPTARLGLYYMVLQVAASLLEVALFPSRPRRRTSPRLSSRTRCSGIPFSFGLPGGRCARSPARRK